MTLPSLRRPADAWGFLVSLLGAVTRPHADTADCDARVETLVADSRIVQALTAPVDACARAASHSVAVAAWRRAISRLVPGSIAERVRAAGCAAVAAAATNLILRLAGAGTEPLTWIVPTVVAVIGAICIAGARPIAQAIVSYRS